MTIRSAGFIGTGYMGSAIAKAVRAGNSELPILLANRHPEKAEALSALLPGSRVCLGADVAREADLIFLGVKPYQAERVLGELRSVLKKRKTPFILVSMISGLTCETIRTLAGGDYPVIRMMPNTPAAIGEGVIQYCSLGAAEEDVTAFAALLGKAGLVDPLEEGLIDAASALSGCGPAFTYMYMEALADGAVACGMPRDKAYRYAAQMVRGSAAMLLQEQGHPGELKDAVCSPGGTTIQGVRVLESSGFRAAAMNAVIAAFNKTVEGK